MHEGGNSVDFREPPLVYASRWRSIRIMYLTMFLSSIGFSICISSVWPYLQLMDHTTSTSFLGWVVAAYSLGQLVASPIFGHWSNKIGSVRLPLIVSISIYMTANILYSYVEDMPRHLRGYSIIAARALIGFGAGNVAVVRSYAADATTLQERTTVMAHISLFQATGFILGPAVQAAFTPIGYPGLVHSKEIYINLYTTPSWISACIGLANLFLVIAVFKEHHYTTDCNIQQAVGDVEESTSLLVNTVDNTPDRLAIAASNYIFFIILFVFSVFETVTTPFSMDMYAWSKQQATLYIGIILACAGVISVLVFLVIKVLVKRISERYLLLSGFIILLLSFAVYLPPGGRHPSVTTSDIFSNTTANMSNTTTPSVGPRGCPVTYSWCLYVPYVYFEQFLGASLLTAIGYPACNVMLYSIYSKILGPKPQGTMMGFLASSGSLGRALGPIFVSQLYDNYGPWVTFICVSGVLFISIIFIICIFKRLVPFSHKASGLINNA